MKNLIRKMLPFVIINGIVYAIIGAIAGKHIVEIHNTKCKMDHDYESLKKLFKDMGGKATHIKLEDLDESEVPEDIREAAEESELKEEL